MTRVLVVDDSFTVRRYYRDILEKAGYQVEEAISGCEALEKVYLQEYDLLLVDVNMPQMDGYSFVRELRGDLNLVQMPVVMISTEGGKQDIDRGYQAGCNMYLVKPLSPEELLAYVELLG